MDEMFLSEFRPPDDSMVEFILGTSLALKAIAEDYDLPENVSVVLGQASHSIKVMLAMAVGGHFLFTNEAKHADALAELAGQLYDHLVLSGVEDASDFDISALHSFHAYREQGPDVNEMNIGGQDIN